MTGNRTLKPRERQILALVADGLSMRDTAEVLGMNYHTVRTYVENIEKAVGVHSLHALTAWAWRSGWMNKDPMAALVMMGRRGL